MAIGLWAKNQLGGGTAEGGGSGSGGGLGIIDVTLTNFSSDNIEFQLDTSWSELEEIADRYRSDPDYVVAVREKGPVGYDLYYINGGEFFSIMPAGTGFYLGSMPQYNFLYTSQSGKPGQAIVRRYDFRNYNGRIGTLTLEGCELNAEQIV